MPEGAVKKLQEEGFLLVSLAESECEVLTETFDAAYRFFREPLTEKDLNKLPEECGYRPTGIEYSQSSSRPDPIESFTASTRTYALGKKLQSASARDLYGRMLAAIDILEPVAESLTILLAEALSGRAHSVSLSGAFRRWSCLQMNYSRPADVTTAFINELHEDGHLITIASATGPGLEVLTKSGQLLPITQGQNEVIVMPGDIAWLLSAGQIQPLYHAVRRESGLRERLALLFFGDIDPRLCEPWLENEVNASIDVGTRVLTNATRFGLRGFTPD